MFKKLVAVAVLCLSVSFSYANAQQYKDGEFLIMMESEDLSKGLDAATIKSVYAELASLNGAMQFIAEIESQGTTVNSPLHLPKKAIYAFSTYDENKKIAMANITRFSEKMEITSLVITQEGKVSINLKQLLSSPVAQRAFKKAGITLTKKEINSMVEVK